jgi:hypothetical protein
MRIPRISTTWFCLGTTWFTTAHLWLPHTLGWLLPYLSAEAVWLALGVWSFVTEDPKQRARRERKLRHQRIRELEKEAGMEPLDLDWPEPMLDAVKRRKANEQS